MCTMVGFQLSGFIGVCFGVGVSVTPKSVKSHFGINSSVTNGNEQKKNRESSKFHVKISLLKYSC